MPCWPSESEWTSLNETVSGRLIKTVPVASVCYPSEPAYNPETCQSVRSNWTTWPFHSADPASVGDPSLDNACSPIYANGTSVSGNPNAGKQGCSLGAYPPYVVNATCAEDVQASVRFAKEWNLRMNIKNTGHGGKRRIWTHHMKDIQYHENFTPRSCSSNRTHMAATLGAGVQDGELYAAMAKHNAIAVGGENNDVGVVGWATGGGHGLATGVYGMGADNIIQAVIVTASGDILTANACQNEDIFWAIRGGGGGTFGVITSVTVNAYKMPSFAMTGIDISSKNDTFAGDWYRLLARLHGEFPRLQDAGIHGYYTMSGAPMAFTLALFEYNTANSTSEAILKPLLEILEAANATATFTTSRLWIPSWYDFVKNVPLFGSTGKMHDIRASRFIPERAVGDTELLARTLEAIAAPSPDLPGVTNPSISGAMTGSKKAVDNALNPAWRDAIVHVITGQSWDDTLSDELATKAIHDMTFKRGYALRQLAPDTGAYFNEANPNEPDWQWSFWGPNYPRLQAIKQKYDPDGLFWCLHCVGSEGWIEMKNGTLCPVM
ncbi:hypothetical protein CNMCM6805_006951 [Aspergillus fumigatiaffinis]|uniref:FAD-binding PCMH-type domain-containing protein n=1 Tax=Aspergillus fumigatiaffinis TaxID=340414 RepID=A0A8H4H6D2_9EURO|nr:hypothetical protein CNMCM5878_003542 [Aspergillus fumigatiaffinis]KAF4237453.1 hypothetical protein CNMCM6805_006951 [Aspergillus fumigatiaffinis]KAF4237936.1 hypothetical protein CNMCM6457_000413 [Aspergillus fumigatiaffinis]